MRSRELELTYDREIGFWVVIFEGRKCLAPRAAQFDLTLDKSSVPCLLGWNRKWFFIMGGMRFDLHPKETYQIKV